MTLEKSYRDIINGRMVEVTLIKDVESDTDWIQSIRIKRVSFDDSEVTIIRQDLQAVFAFVNRLPLEIKEAVFAMVKEEIK